MVRRTVHGISTTLGIVASICTAVMMLAIVGDVASREFRGRGLLGTIELSESLLVAVIFLGLAYAERTGRHVSLSLAFDRMPPRIAFWAQTLGLLVAVGLLGWISYRAGLQAWTSYERGEFRFGIMQFPMWPARTAMFVGLAALVLEMLVTLVDSVRSALAGGPVGVWEDRLDASLEDRI